MKEIKQYIFYFVISVLLTFINLMWTFQDITKIQSSALASFEEEVYISSIIAGIFMLIISFLSRKIKSFQKRKKSVYIIGYSIILFFLSNLLLESQVTNWSTYLTYEVWLYTLQLATFPLLFSTLLLTLILFVNRKKKNIFFIIVLIIFFRFWIGIYADAEFGGKYPFIKHKPIWKFFFYAPLGMSDETLDNLTKIKQKEQLLYEEFIYWDTNNHSLNN